MDPYVNVCSFHLVFFQDEYRKLKYVCKPENNLLLTDFSFPLKIHLAESHMAILNRLLKQKSKTQRISDC